MILFELYLYTLSISFEHDNPMICSLMSLKLGKARNCILSSNDSSSFTYLQRHNFTRWYRSQSLSDKDLLVAKNLWDEQYQMMIYVCIDSNNIFPYFKRTLFLTFFISLLYKNISLRDQNWKGVSSEASGRFISNFPKI